MKINNFDEHAKSSLDEWIFYLKNGQLPKNYRAKGLKEVEEKLKYDQMEPAEKKRYNKFMKDSLLTRSQYETALFEGEQKGLEKGKAERNRQIVLTSLKKGLSAAFIAEIVGISIEEVEQIINEG